MSLTIEIDKNSNYFIDIFLRISLLIARLYHHVGFIDQTIEHTFLSANTFWSLIAINNQ